MRQHRTKIHFLDCNPASIGPNPHTKSTEFLLIFSYTGLMMWADY